MRGGNSRWRVFKHHALRGRHAQPRCRLQEDIRRRLAALDIRAGNRDGKPCSKCEGLQAQIHILARRGGTHCTGDAQLARSRQKIENAGDRADAVAADPFAVEFFFFETEAVGFLFADRPAQ
ncbi:MAG: hypothetical protein BWX54_02229 [Verrucomicrobia bacterium ADurb.Bin018]|nr:MAG: hypothetical protein BWX54_02229 [Verrucomicrobia bacterium ADurb.Bin018]